MHGRSKDFHVRKSCAACLILFEALWLSKRTMRLKYSLLQVMCSVSRTLLRGKRLDERPQQHSFSSVPQFQVLKGDRAARLEARCACRPWRRKVQEICRPVGWWPTCGRCGCGEEMRGVLPEKQRCCKFCRACRWRMHTSR
eukprot:762859-Hanusia_phi.AAC.2